MFKQFATAAVGLFCCASVAQAGSTADTVTEALYSGAFARGLSTLEPMAASGDSEAAFGVGAIKLTMTLQSLAQTLYRHGFDMPRSPLLGIVVGMRIPQNPDPEPFDYAGVRQMLIDLEAGLDDARASFDAAAKSGEYVIEVDPLKVRIDANGDGTAEAGESLAGLYALWMRLPVVDVLARRPHSGLPLIDPFGFDRADAYWLAGYPQAVAAQADFLLAHDFSSFVDATFHRAFPRAGFPMQDYSQGIGRLVMDPETDMGIADVIAAIHTIDWPVTDASRLSSVRLRLKAVLGYSRQNWDAIMLETDDNHELLPSPRQTPMVKGVSVTDERVAAWRATLDEADGVLDGDLLVPHWRFKQGFDLKAYFDTATRTDVVMLLTGFDAVPFLKDGPVASATDFRAIQAAFGNDWPGYAFWFN